MRLALLLLTLCVSSYASLVGDVRLKLSAGDLLSADALADEYLRANGSNSEYAAAIAWLARGALALHDTPAAARYLAQAKSLIGSLQTTKKSEDDAFLASAIGATIEVEAQLLAAHGEKDRAVALLTHELPKWQIWGIRSRIQKNLNLLTLEGKPAPKMPEELRGKPVLMFLWAHWCGDCKGEAPVIARIRDKYASKGLAVLAPTRRYGYTKDIEHASPEQEDREIEKVWSEAYAALSDVAHPVSDEMMQSYGVSSTPTLVLIDRAGIVRMYRPSRMSDTELEGRIEPLLKPRPR